MSSLFHRGWIFGACLGGLAAARMVTGCSSEDSPADVPDAGGPSMETRPVQPDGGATRDGGDMRPDSGGSADSGGGDDGGDGGPILIVGDAGVVHDISMGGSHACALVDTPAGRNQIECWGDRMGNGLDDPDGRWGLPLYGAASDPAGVMKMPPPDPSSSFDVKQATSAAAPVRLPAPHTPSSIYVTQYGLCTQEGTGGAVRCWGARSYRGDTSNVPSAVWPFAPLLDGVKSFATGGNGSCALKSSGEIWCWGPSVLQVPVPLPKRLPLDPTVSAPVGVSFAEGGTQGVFVQATYKGKTAALLFTSVLDNVNPDGSANPDFLNGNLDKLTPVFEDQKLPFSSVRPPVSSTGGLCAVDGSGAACARLRRNGHLQVWGRAPSTPFPVG